VGYVVKILTTGQASADAGHGALEGGWCWTYGVAVIMGFAGVLGVEKGGLGVVEQ
jgi:hypothetical protein